MKRIPVFFFLSIFSILLLACGNNNTTETTTQKDTMDKVQETGGPVSVKEEAVSYETGNETMKSFVAFDQSKEGRRPVVLILPEWWGLTDYPRMRARMLAEMGYLAMAVDLYGDGMVANSPEEAQKAAGPFYSNPTMAKERMDAAMKKVKTLPQADTTQVIAIGYCFGGSMALNYGKMGAPLLGVVSFHGNLEGVAPQSGIKTQFLICHGGNDSFVPQEQVKAFKNGMDSAGLPYTFKVYEGATHAFTNPDATEKGNQFNMPIRYNPQADSASWNDMKMFFERIIK